MKELMLDASVENIPVVTDFVDEQLKEYGCPMEVRRQIHIAIDELFGNIAHYAYQPDVGPAVVRMEVTEDPLTAVLTFTDRGVPYNTHESVRARYNAFGRRAAGRRSRHLYG